MAYQQTPNGNHFIQPNPNQVVYGNGQRYQPGVQSFGTGPCYSSYPPNTQPNPQPNPQQNYPPNYPPTSTQPPNPNSSHQPIRGEIVHFGNTPFYNWRGCWYNCELRRPRTTAPQQVQQVVQQPEAYEMAMQQPPPPPQPVPINAQQSPVYQIREQVPPPQPPPQAVAHDPRLQGVYMMTGQPQMPPQGQSHCPQPPQRPTQQQVPLSFCVVQSQPPQLQTPQLQTPQLQAPQLVEIVLGPSVGVTRTDDKLILDFRALYPPRPVHAMPDPVNESEQISEGVQPSLTAECISDPPSGPSHTMPSTNESAEDGSQNSAVNGEQQLPLLEILQHHINIVRDLAIILEQEIDHRRSPNERVHSQENLDMVENLEPKTHHPFPAGTSPAQCMDLPTSQPEIEPCPVPNLVAEHQEVIQVEQSHNSTPNEVKKPPESETFYEDVSVNKATESEKPSEATPVIQPNLDRKSPAIAHIEKQMDQLHIADPLPDLVTTGSPEPVQNERITNSQMTYTLPKTIPQPESIDACLLKVIEKENIPSNILQPIQKSDLASKANISATRKKKLPVLQKPVHQRPHHKSIGASLLQDIEKENITSNIIQPIKKSDLTSKTNISETQKKNLSVPQKPLNQWPPLDTRSRTKIAPKKEPFPPENKLQKPGSFRNRNIYKSMEQTVPPAVEKKGNVLKPKTDSISPAKRIERNNQQGVRKTLAKPKVAETQLPQAKIRVPQTEQQSPKSSSLDKKPLVNPKYPNNTIHTSQVKKDPETKSPPTKKPMIILEKREATHTQHKSKEPVTDSLVTISNMFELLLDEPETHSSEVDDEDSFQPEAQTVELVPQRAVSSKKEKRRLKKMNTAQKKLEISNKKAEKEAIRAKKAADKAKDLESSQKIEESLGKIQKNEFGLWQLTDPTKKSLIKPIAPPPSPPGASPNAPEGKRKNPGLSKFLSAVNVAALKKVVVNRRELFEKRKPSTNELDITPTLRLRSVIPAAEDKEPTQSTPPSVPPQEVMKCEVMKPIASCSMPKTFDPVPDPVPNISELPDSGAQKLIYKVPPRSEFPDRRSLDRKEWRQKDKLQRRYVPFITFEELKENRIRI